MPNQTKDLAGQIRIKLS